MASVGAYKGDGLSVRHFTAIPWYLHEVILAMRKRECAFRKKLFLPTENQQ